jgi:hypothetical protein
VAKTFAKLTIGITALAVTTWFGTSSSRAYGDAPWCAVINIGVIGVLLSLGSRNAPPRFLLGVPQRDAVIQQ